MPKHIPERTCIGCRKKQAKDKMLRLVFRPPDTVLVDARQNLPGRGAYLCKSRDCWQLARKRRALARAFRTHVPAACYETLTAYFNELEAKTEENPRHQATNSK